MGLPSGADHSGQMGGLPSAAAGLEAQKVEVMGPQEARTQICGPGEGDTVRPPPSLCETVMSARNPSEVTLPRTPGSGPAVAPSGAILTRAGGRKQMGAKGWLLCFTTGETWMHF